MAMGRSKADPSLRMSAGARFTVMFWKWVIESAVLDGRFDSFFAFLHGSIRQPDRQEYPIPGRDVDLHFYHVGIDSKDRRTECLK